VKSFKESALGKRPASFYIGKLEIN